MVSIAEENVSGFTFSHDALSGAIPPGETQDLRVTVTAEDEASAEATFTFTYYPPADQTAVNQRTYMVALAAESEDGSGGLAIGIAIVAVAIIAFILWKKIR
jgi:uncharacterized membrane protein